ncbi:transcriptional regulator Kaiso isoform X2 [Cryptotermes secundus]|uniref:transcriptional regulator Kaiso isoform X2 n=1 Tax=Cryptotermes secundus TaxID=105785 RepID=UPI000CD7D805|nr:transcriptional regulator Kaiso isoform X2 [Cryptotermes secundus]
MVTVATTESLTELAKVLEFFFKGLAECGLLTTYSVQLQGTAVDFAVQIKYQSLLFQFIKSLQSVLLKIPSLPGHEYNREISTQTTEETNLIEVNLHNAPTSNVSEQLGSLVEACVFTQTDDSLELVDDEWRELKGEISTSFIAQSKAMGTTTDIIVTCHPASLAAISNHSFVAAPVSEVSTAVSNDDSVLIKPCINGSVVRGDDCSPTVEEESPPGSLTGTELVTVEAIDRTAEQHQSTTETIIDSGAKTALKIVAVTNLKPFMITNPPGVLSNSFKVAFGSQQEVESLVLQTYEREDTKDCDDVSGAATNVMRITVASEVGPPAAHPEPTEVEKNGKEEAKDGEADTGTAIFICEMCDKTFESACSLEVHQSEKHRTQGQCDLCQQRFGTTQSLQGHCQAKHGGRGCFTCVVCDKHFMTKLSYRRHMNTHGGKKGAVCDMCGKTFSRPDYLQKHYMTHTGHRPHQCAECPRKFISSSQLKVHQRVTHVFDIQTASCHSDCSVQIANLRRSFLISPSHM